MKKTTTTTKSFVVVVVASCTQERRKGYKTLRGKHQETNTNQNQNHKNVKRVCSPQEEHNDEEECDDNCCCFHLLHTRKERGEYTTRGNTRKQMKTKPKRKITKGITRNHGFSKGST
jgi:hypothetical protein